MTADIADGECAQVKGSGSAIYTLKNSGGVYSCTCPAWMHQGLGIERRTCKHLRAYRGDEPETARVGAAQFSGRPSKPKRVAAPGEEAVDDDEEGPPLLLAHKWENDVDLTGWWLSEKLDGVRAYWDGTQFISRLGNKFFAPKWFVEKFPMTPLDGELWGGRKLFQRTVGIVKRQDESELWKELKYMVFDAPSHEGLFEERVAFIESTVQALGIAWLVSHSHTRCEGTQQLREELARVEALGGEGLMVRQPKSRYEAGRSNTLLKVKSFHDSEARVLGHVPGLGRHKGRLGAVLVELEDGTQFNVGTGFSDVERASPPAIGSIITFRYQELSSAGVPRFPSYVGERIDGKFVSNATMKALTMPTRRFEDDGEARENTEKKIAEKIAKGFAEVGGGGAAAAKKKSPFDEEDDDAPAPAATAGASKSGQGGPRYFEFIEGTSSKFWEIRVEGSTFFTRYGKIGTDGQMTQKDFDSDTRAEAEAQKLIAEKAKKGYSEK